MTDDFMNAMYGQEGGDEKRPQPEQLRLAGKATVTTINDRQIAIPRMDYVEMLETRLLKAEQLLADQTALIKRLLLKMSNNANIAHRKINALESEVRKQESWKKY